MTALALSLSLSLSLSLQTEGTLLHDQSLHALVPPPLLSSHVTYIHICTIYERERERAKDRQRENWECCIIGSKME